MIFYLRFYWVFTRKIDLLTTLTTFTLVLDAVGERMIEREMIDDGKDKKMKIEQPTRCCVCTSQRGRVKSLNGETASQRFYVMRSKG